MASKEWDKLPQDIRLAIEAHQITAPVKISSLARDLDVIIKGATLPPGISGEIRPSPSGDGKFVIRINKHDPSTRQRFTAAHELAHYLLHTDQIGDGVYDDVLYRSQLTDNREAEANRLAADILMPESLLNEWMANAKALKIDNIVEYLADRFGVSEAAIKIRLGIK